MTQAYPLAWPEGWPRTHENKRESYARFQTTFDRARRQLLDELRAYRDKNFATVSVELWCHPDNRHRVKWERKHNRP